MGLTTLGSDPPPDAVEVVLRRLGGSLNGADPLRRATIREAAVHELKTFGINSAGKIVDAAFAPPEPEGDADGGQGRAVVLSDPEPWPEPVGGVDLLADLVEAFGRFLAQSPEAAAAEALWTVHAHAHDGAFISPLLAFTSAMHRCGKSTAGFVLGALVPRPLSTSNITAAALFRTVEAYRPTLLVDEADTFLRDREELRGLLNSGHTRAGAVVIRTAGDDHEARMFSTWCPKTVALIGELPPTLRDRAIEIRMRRRRPDETVERLRLDRLGDLEPLRRQCARWAADHLEKLRAADPNVPSELGDRAADNWRPLLAIADLVGGNWPLGARRAAKRLSGTADDDGDASILLLTDLRELFEKRGTDRLASEEIVAALKTMEDRPWPEWRRGQPITTRQLAALLKRFDVRPKKLRFGSHPPVQGYERAMLADAFERYTPSRSVAPPQSIRNNRNIPATARKTRPSRSGT